MIEKNGMLTGQAHCDFDSTEKATFFDEVSEKVASEKHKSKLTKPKLIKEALDEITVPH